MHRILDNRLMKTPKGLLILSFAILTGCVSVGDPVAPNNEALLAEAEQALQQGELSTAKQNLQQALTADPEDLDVLQMLLRLAVNAGNADGQRTTAAQITAIQPGHPYALERLGLLALADNQLSAASEYLQHCVGADPGNWAAWNGLGVIADARSMPEDAEKYYRRGLQIVPGHPKMMANLGWSRLLAGEAGEAEQLLRQSLENAPDEMITRSNLAFSIALQGRYDEAMQSYLALYDRSVAANNVGYAALLRNDSAGAREYFQDAMRSKPSYYQKAANNLQIAEALNR